MKKVVQINKKMIMKGTTERIKSRMIIAMKVEMELRIELTRIEFINSRQVLKIEMNPKL